MFLDYLGKLEKDDFRRIPKSSNRSLAAGHLFYKLFIKRGADQLAEGFIY